MVAVNIGARTPVDLKTFKISFGKYKGLSFKEVWRKDKSYVSWLVRETALKASIPTEIVNGVVCPDYQKINQELSSVNPIPTPAPSVNDPSNWKPKENWIGVEPLANFDWIVFP